MSFVTLSFISQGQQTLSKTLSLGEDGGGGNHSVMVTKSSLPDLVIAK